MPKLVYDHDTGKLVDPLELAERKARELAEARLKMGLDASPSSPHLRRNVTAKPERRCVSHTLPRWWKNAPRHDQYGRPVFTSQREIDEAAAKSDDTGPHPYVWDD